MILQGYILSTAYIVLVIALTWFIRKKFVFTDEVYRKFLHISISFAWPIMYYTLAGTIHLFILMLGLVVVSLIGIKLGIFDVLSRGNEKHTLGIVLFPVSIFFMVIITQFIPNAVYACGLGIFALSFGDGLAALIGKRYGKYTPRLYDNKSVAGTLACITFAFFGMALVSLLMGHIVSAWKLLVLGTLAAVIELFSGDWDNIAIPIPVMLVAYLVNV